MKPSTIRILVVEDYEPWRRRICACLTQEQDFQVIAEASDGIDAVAKARALHPDLILLDIGLPNLNGIEVAQEVFKHTPHSNILFVSDNRDRDIVEEALSTGAGGYVVKLDSMTELIPAIRAVLHGKKFVSSRLVARNSFDFSVDPTYRSHERLESIAVRQGIRGPHNHEVGFYSEDEWFLDDLARFVGGALKVQNAAVVVATASHLRCLLPRLQMNGLDIGTSVEQGRYITLDAADTLSVFMIDGMLDPGRFLNAFGDVISRATRAAKGEHPRVAVFGECVQLLWAQGNPEAAIQAEKLGNQLTDAYDLDILCGYSVDNKEIDRSTFQRICAEHSAVHSR